MSNVRSVLEQDRMGIEVAGTIILPPMLGKAFVEANQLGVVERAPPDWDKGVVPIIRDLDARD
jgi:hypothetical protein